MAEGVYEHGETGLRLRNIAATRRVRPALGAHHGILGRATARAARLTGDGSIDWEEGFDGGVEFAATNLRGARPGRPQRDRVWRGRGDAG